ncbi:uncharacterized protein FIBRA_05947 [Fibroporia radiculosa]|uniref:Aminodeoxychorismate lyase n=1 Tax=Fibroporia radiculosa TaxID=599839 RepID=J4H3T4_9APHY|nr:uncharacterized protein FIBRA_05947 [Fibroporia radiculosa]CCM03799.1 predicted protein [Fibroporia radiculosa]
MALAPNLYHLLSSTRYDSSLLAAAWNTAANEGLQSPYLFLRYHHDRLVAAARQHGWHAAQGGKYDDLQHACDRAVHDAHSRSDSAGKPMKVRILLSENGVFLASAAVATTLPILDPTAVARSPPPETDTPSAREMLLADTTLIIYPDICSTTSSLFTQTKTTHRPQYDAARARMGIPPLPAPSTADVLLYSPSGGLTETSIRNIAFWRRSPPCWITPPVAVGCLPGVMRRWLIAQGIVVEARADELRREDIGEGEIVMTFNSVEGCRLALIQFK